jgi:molybdate transport system regulatory protein
VRRSPQATPPPIPRAKLWIERAGKLALSDAGADLLEQIEAAGSLSEAARRLRYSYRRAWMLLDAMNKQWDLPLVITSTGGERGGGARLTELGSRVLRSFRDMQVQIEATIDRETEGFHRAVREK